MMVISNFEHQLRLLLDKYPWEKYVYPHFPHLQITMKVGFPIKNEAKQTKRLMKIELFPWNPNW